MELQGDVYSLWVPAGQTTNGIEYYFQAENAIGSALATLPERIQRVIPIPCLPRVCWRKGGGRQQRRVRAGGRRNGGNSGGALAQDTELRVAALSAPPAPPNGITATDVGYAFSFANGAASFAEPLELTFSYADSDVAGLNPPTCGSTQWMLKVGSCWRAARWIPRRRLSVWT